MVLHGSVIMMSTRKAGYLSQVVGEILSRQVHESEFGSVEILASSIGRAEKPSSPLELLKHNVAKLAVTIECRDIFRSHDLSNWLMEDGVSLRPHHAGYRGLLGAPLVEQSGDVSPPDVQCRQEELPEMSS